jgi:single-stranded DNA-binding protein
MNSVHLIGRLATDVDVKEVNGGSKVSSFILAVDRNAEEADFAILHTKVRGAGDCEWANAASERRQAWRIMPLP